MWISIIFGFLLRPFSLILNLVPKKKNTWVFGCWYGKKYSDNSKYFFEYCSNSSSINSVWITKNKDTLDEIISKGYSAYLSHSILGMYYQLIADYAFISHSVFGDLNPHVITGKTKVVQLWHGLALKKIMYDSFSKKEILVRNITGYISPQFKHRYDYVVSSSEETSNIFSSAFSINKKYVLETGLPRNDVFSLVNNEKSATFKAIYMPTFRAGLGNNIDLFDGFDFDKVDKEFNSRNIELWFRIHPANKPSDELIQKINNSSSLNISSEDDIYESIAKYDCLITDFSSVYIDFLLTGKPIIFATFDFDDFIKNERGLYYEYEDVTVAPYCSNWNSVFKELILIKETGIQKETYKYSKLQKFFHGNVNDGNNCSRLFNKLMEIEDGKFDTR